MFHPSFGIFSTVSIAASMNSSDYLDGTQEYETLYPQTVMDSDSQDSPVHNKKPHFYSPSHAKHFDCFCGKIFISKADYNRHMLIHTGERPHECEICGKAFSLKGNLTKHMMLHTEEKSYHCPDCGKGFLKKGYIDQHMRVHTGEKPFVCPHCNRAFSLKGNLAQHIKLHTDEKSYSCMQCNKLFLKKSYLVQHMRVHSGLKPHKCNLCSRAFNLKGNLVQHLKRHSGRKPFKCLECGKAFALKGALREHEKIHGGDKPFVCNVCSKAFNKKAYLTQHERTHTGERPFHCLECGKSFSQRSILNQHMKQHGERSYKCCQCHKIFLKKLSEINKAVKNNRFGGFKCNECEILHGKGELGSDGNVSVFLKEEQSLSGYDAQSYIQDDNMSLYNLDSLQKADEFDRLRLLKLTRLEEDCTSSSDKQCNTSLVSESSGLNERPYEFDTSAAQPSGASAPAEVKKYVDYSPKKVAIAHALSKESSKRPTNQNKVPASATNIDEMQGQNKMQATYTELKVVEKHRIPGSTQTQDPSLLETPISQKQLCDERKKLEAVLKASGGEAKEPSETTAEKNSSQTCAEPSVKESDVVKTGEKSQQNNVKSASEQSGELVADASKTATNSDKTSGHTVKKHPASGNDSQNSSSVEESESRRAFLYSQSSLSDYNARNLDSLRYIENLQRNFSGIRHGNVPEVESALSRFGIKGYYNSPWSFAGNYPE
ncbi:zinc finger protein 835-like [Macrobrachium nipponense]|uniref:zinc finger protein 835-like n=1 Tax=Macrobrachium nipponense TaxID=159736 RepID=UPI0030C7F807